jgi:hypothetical protein
LNSLRVAICMSGSYCGGEDVHSAVRRGAKETGSGLARDEVGNAGAVSSADGELLSIGHCDKAFSVIPVRPKFLDVLKIYDRRAMHPQENLGVQLGLEIRHRIAEHMALFAGADSFFCVDRAASVAGLWAYSRCSRAC